MAPTNSFFLKLFRIKKEEERMKMKKIARICGVSFDSFGLRCGGVKKTVSELYL